MTNPRKHFSDILVTDLTNKVAAFEKEGEPMVFQDMDIFYSVDTQELAVFTTGEHGWSEDDADIALWDWDGRGSLSKVVDEILSEIVENLEIPEGGFYRSPITWGPPLVETLIIENLQVLPLKDQSSLWRELSPLAVNLEENDYDTKEMTISFHPGDREKIVAILNRYAKRN